jgi:DNA primase catalytic subunit
LFVFYILRGNRSFFWADKPRKSNVSKILPVTTFRTIDLEGKKNYGLLFSRFCEEQSVFFWISPKRLQRLSSCFQRKPGTGRAQLQWLRKNSKIGGWGLEGAWLQPRLTALFKDLRHGFPAVPLQNSNVREFFRKLFSRATRPQLAAALAAEGAYLISSQGALDRNQRQDDLRDFKSTLARISEFYRGLDSFERLLNVLH